VTRRLALAAALAFETPSGNIACAFVQPRSPDIGKVECIVLSTRNRVGEPKEWQVDYWRTVQVFRTN
jgi:hypothetical protein